MTMTESTTYEESREAARRVERIIAAYAGVCEEACGLVTDLYALQEEWGQVGPLPPADPLHRALYVQDVRAVMRTHQEMLTVLLAVQEPETAPTV
jgi:hypothetical protein